MFERVRALITGIGGFVGRHLTTVCTQSGDDVFGLDLIDPEPGVTGALTVYPADITEGKMVETVVADVRPEVIYHLAGSASVGASFADPLATWRANTFGTLAVLDAARRHAPGARIVVVTSAEVYGIVPVALLPVTELTPIQPNSPYGASKAAAEIAARQYRDVYGLDVTIVRPFNHIGPGQDPRFVVPSIAQQIAQAEASGTPRVELHVGNLVTRRDFLDVRDVVRAYRQIAVDGGRGQTYVVATGRSQPVGDLVASLAQMSTIPVDIISDASRRRDGEQPDLYGCANHLTNEVGWSPSISLESSLRDTLQWWRARVSQEA